jgi:hypothetical protein
MGTGVSRYVKTANQEGFTGCVTTHQGGKKCQGTTLVVSPWAFGAPKWMKTHWNAPLKPNDLASVFDRAASHAK